MNQHVEKQLPAKSYLAPEERKELEASGDMELVYLAESQEATRARDFDTAWAWLVLIRLPTSTLLSIKRWHGAEFIRKMGIDTSRADADLGKDWLEKPLD